MNGIPHMAIKTLCEIANIPICFLFERHTPNREKIMAIVLLKQTGLKYSEIKQELDMKNHGSITYAMKAHFKLLKEDYDYRSVFNLASNKINSN